MWNLSQLNTTASSSLSMFAYRDSASDSLLLANAMIFLSFISVAPVYLSQLTMFAFGLKYARHRFSWMDFLKF